MLMFFLILSLLALFIMPWALIVIIPIGIIYLMISDIGKNIPKQINQYINFIQDNKLIDVIIISSIGLFIFLLLMLIVEHNFNLFPEIVDAIMVSVSLISIIVFVIALLKSIFLPKKYKN